MKSNQVELNLYISSNQHYQIGRLRETGINLSSLARLAIRKCAHIALDLEDETAKNKRIQVYLGHEDAAVLQHIADELGCSRAMAMRRLLSTYLRINAVALESLF